MTSITMCHFCTEFKPCMISSNINSSPPSAAHMHQWTGSALVQIIACRLLVAKPLPEPMLPYWQLYSWEQISVKFESEFYHLHSRKYIWKCRLPEWRPFCPGGDGLMKAPCLDRQAVMYVASSSFFNSLRPGDAYMRQFSNHHWSR